jgi:plastocyanin
MQANSQVEVGIFWVPDEAGEYQIRVLTLVGFDAFGFGRIATSKIDIAESNKTVIVIPNDPDPSVQQSSFEPTAIKVVLGVNSTVTFVNQDSVPHRLVVEHDSADQVAFQKYVFVPSYASFVYNFTDTGGFWYSDRDRDWMQGYVEVYQ